MTEPSDAPPTPTAPIVTDGARDLGVQPIAALMDALGLTAKDVVRASTEQITHKMVQRARKGRRLSPHVMAKILNAFNAASEGEHSLSDLFTYAPNPGTRSTS